MLSAFFEFETELYEYRLKENNELNIFNKSDGEAIDMRKIRILEFKETSTNEPEGWDE